MPKVTIGLDDLVIHVLNVGFGDNIVIELPRDGGGERRLGIVDCCDATKTLDYVKKLKQARDFKRVAFICATHPHKDHISGIKRLLDDDLTRPEEFWDSGFRHNSTDYCKLLKAVVTNRVSMVRVSSGMEWYYGRVRVSALSPSVTLRNRYATYGVDMNNASVVLRLEHCADDVVNIQSLRYTALDDPDYVRSKQNPAVAILGGDAEFDSWACIAQEYPYQEKDCAEQALLREKKLVNLLACGLLKVSHHGSMHSIPLAVCEQAEPTIAVISTKQELETKKVPWGELKRPLFPHPVTRQALEEVKARIITTDGSYEKETGLGLPGPGTIVVVLRHNEKLRYTRLGDKENEKAEVITGFDMP